MVNEKYESAKNKLIEAFDLLKESNVDGQMKACPELYEIIDFLDNSGALDNLKADLREECDCWNSSNCEF